MSKIDHKKWAKTFLIALIHRVRDLKSGEKSITYGDLSDSVGYPGPYTGSNFSNNIGDTLGEMGHMFDGKTVDGMKIPFIQALVVAKSKGLPGKGLKEFYPSYPDLSDEKKRDYVKLVHKQIDDFGERWIELLSILDLNKDGYKTKKHDKKKSYNPWGSEGSPEHIALREYIVKNPDVVGLEKGIKGTPEYPLKSGDRVDVVFELANETVGVEVKSRRSGFYDLERGIYQCVKYTSVLEAEEIIKGSKSKARCILVTEEGLPKKLLKVQKKLGVEILENISVK